MEGTLFLTFHGIKFIYTPSCILINFNSKNIFNYNLTKLNVNKNTEKPSIKVSYLIS